MADAGGWSKSPVEQVSFLDRVSAVAPGDRCETYEMYQLQDDSWDHVGTSFQHSGESRLADHLAAKSACAVDDVPRCRRYRCCHRGRVADADDDADSGHPDAAWKYDAEVAVETQLA